MSMVIRTSYSIGMVILPGWSGLLPVLLEDSAAGHESSRHPVYLKPLV